LLNPYVWGDQTGSSSSIPGTRFQINGSDRFIPEEHHPMHVDHVAQLKRHEHDATRAFEALRSSFFIDSFHRYTLHLQALSGLIAVENAATDRVLVWYSKHVSAYRTFAKGLCETNDAVSGQRRGTTKFQIRETVASPSSLSPDGSPEPMRGKAGINSSNSNSISNSASPDTGGRGRPPRSHLAVGGKERNTDKVLDELCRMDVSTAVAVNEPCDYLQAEIIAKMVEMLTYVKENVDSLIREAEKLLALMQHVDEYTTRLYEVCHNTGAAVLLAPGDSLVGASKPDAGAERRTPEVSA
jgi:hypothetical protein